MKKFIILFFAVLFMGCNVQTKVNNSGIPDKCKTLQFYNGGGLIGDYKDVNLEVEIITTTKVVGDNISFYKYHVYSKEQNMNDYIIDSEALALKFTLYE